MKHSQSYTVAQRRELEKLQRGDSEYIASLKDEELLAAYELCRARDWNFGYAATAVEMLKRKGK